MIYSSLRIQQDSELSTAYVQTLLREVLEPASRLGEKAEDCDRLFLGCDTMARPVTGGCGK